MGSMRAPSRLPHHVGLAVVTFQLHRFERGCTILVTSLPFTLVDFWVGLDIKISFDRSSGLRLDATYL
jgi:hypothetical protein